MMSIHKVFIITGLPFRRQGNQSLIRFVKMFINKEINVILFTSGYDMRGHNTMSDVKFKLNHLPMIREKFYKIFRIFHKKKSYSTLEKENVYITITSETILPPFGLHTFKTILNKWFYFLLNIIDNLIALFYLLFFHFKDIKSSDIIIGYEVNYTLVAKILAKLFNKKYVNKFQGVTLKATNRNISECIKYYPLIYFGINKSDLCIMVNDGTDGYFYARQRGCKNILFEPHGVGVEDYDINVSLPIGISQLKEKFIFFNNASGSRWKRADRCIRALTHLKPEVLEKIVYITTYHGDDWKELEVYSESLGLKNTVLFIDSLDHKQSNALLRCSHALIMTNEMSNLGNPVLEAIYYAIPIVSINDGSLDGFIQDGLDGILIDLDNNFDNKMSDTLEQIIIDKDFYSNIKRNLLTNASVNSLEKQQNNEFQQITKCLSNDSF